MPGRRSGGRADAVGSELRRERRPPIGRRGHACSLPWARAARPLMHTTGTGDEGRSRARSWGYALKERLQAHLASRRHEVLDLGAHDATPSDYADHALAVGLAVLDGRAERAILICGSGVDVAARATSARHRRSGVPRPLPGTKASSTGERLHAVRRGGARRPMCPRRVHGAARALMTRRHHGKDGRRDNARIQEQAATR